MNAALDRIVAEFAVLVPAYNSEKWISFALNSIQAQSGLEDVALVLLADDGSCDATVEVAQEVWTCDVPMRVLRQPRNRGERANVNSALATLFYHVDWVLVLHSDDIAKPGWVAALRDRAKRCDSRVATICCSWDTMTLDGQVVPGEESGAPHRTIAGTAEAVRRTLMRGCWWHVSGCAMRMAALKEIGGFDERLPQHGDWDWLLRCLSYGYAVEYIPRSLVLYRQHAQSVSAESFETDRDIREAVEIAYRYRRYLTLSDVSLFHWRRLSWAVRRMARAMSRGQLRRAMRSISTAAYVASACYRGLLRKAGSPPAGAAFGADHPLPLSSSPEP